MKLHILAAGPMTTVQDLGRIGYQAYGVTSAGVMDRRAYRQANELVGNRPGAAVLEATLMGPKIEIEGEGIIAVTGADMPMTLDGETIQRGEAYSVHNGQVLTLGFSTNGVRSYIAVSGGIDVPAVMGSRSTDVKGAIGGFQGRKLQNGDVLSTVEAGTKTVESNKHFAPEKYDPSCKVRVIMGPQDDYFTDEDIDLFLHQTYKVTPDSDRMGIRLSGPALKGKEGMDIISDGITFGSIQVTSGGLPIILMADHQTTGGYAKIATVVTEDLPLLAQACPGTEIHFSKVTVEEMQKSSVFTRMWRRFVS